MPSPWELLPGLTEQPPVQWTGEPFDGSAFAVQELADSSVGLALSAAAELATVRSGEESAAALGLHRNQSLASFSGYLRVDGEPVPNWADLSGMYQTGDGRYIQLHCNFPHHGAGVVEHLGTGENRADVAAAIARRPAVELETELVSKGLIAAAVRTLDEWKLHPHAVATRDLPLLEVSQLGDASPRVLPPLNPSPGRRGPDSAAAGLRVVDCSRVLAGPVCGQTLAGAGADVLRVGAAHLPSVPVGVMSTGFGKRNAFIDFSTASGLETMLGLSNQANIVVDAYRPGALAGHGLSPELLAANGPGVVVVQLCAFDWTGPWAGRRGFDSIVQSTTGIAATGADMATNTENPGQAPRPLPFQALDYATGFLAAFAAMRMVAHQQRVGGSWLVRLSLLRTRNWLLSLGDPTPFIPTPLPDLSPWLHAVDSDFGEIEAPSPVLGTWDRPPAPLGSSEPVWL